MTKIIRREKKFIGTPVQKKLLTLIFFSAVIPMGIAILSLYYLIFNLLAWQIGMPEAVAQNLAPVIRKINAIILIGLPIAILIIWVVALEISHRIAGPLFRLEKELDDRLAGKTEGHIKLRPKDEFRHLVDKINKLLHRQF
jgi:methyl-accepting chemotaxis protein